MSLIISRMADQTERLAAAMQRIRTTPGKVEVIPRPTTDTARAQSRTRLEDRKEIAALRKRLGL